MRFSFSLLLPFISYTLIAQTLGGRAAFNFVQLPATPLLTAAGGINISLPNNEVGLANYNPALLTPSLSKHFNVSFSPFAEGVKSYSLTAAYELKKSATVFGAQVFYMDYGSIPQADAGGNVSGTFRPKDFVVQGSASRAYLQKWRYGATIKFINSSYQQYRANAFAVDVGVLYKDSANGLSAAVLSKNVGFEGKTYAGEKEDLPFDLQVGVTKRLEKAPFAFSITLQHLQNFDINYSDTVFNIDNNNKYDKTALHKIFTHFIFATHIFLGNNLEATLGYNVLRRDQLKVGSVANGLTGFSGGLRIKFQKLQLLYSVSSYQKNVLFNHFGITMQLDQMGILL
ncbi:MAG: type IX secretion system protein PorQ [Candidatus Dadabacteria bacterium]